MVQKLLLIILALILILAVVQPQVSCHPAKNEPTHQPTPTPPVTQAPLEPRAPGEIIPTEPNRDLPTVTMQLGGRAFTLEVTSTELTRQTGMMFRDSMPDDHGMIFVFAREQPLAFWMNNTRIPLDIIYLDARQRIVSTHTMQAHDTRTTPSAKPAKWAIELNQGVVAKLGLKRGDRLEIPEGALYSKE